MAAGEVESPSTTVTLGFEARDLAFAEEASRDRARIWNGEELARRASITAPPCFPVAPVMRSLRVAIVKVS